MLEPTFGVVTASPRLRLTGMEFGIWRLNRIEWGRGVTSQRSSEEVPLLAAEVGYAVNKSRDADLSMIDMLTYEIGEM